jgi:hypothetical protein
LLKIVRGISELPWENKKFTLEIDHETLTSLFKIQEENTEKIYTITNADENYLEMILKSYILYE